MPVIAMAALAATDHEITSIVAVEDTPSSLIVNWDLTGTSWTMEIRESKQVEVGGL